ncbi:MAG TPA: glycoside hydrolase family 31 protein [bacterium]|nr:glycoside hydrolase family 31 protein [bacterium]
MFRRIMSICTLAGALLSSIGVVWAQTPIAQPGRVLSVENTPARVIFHCEGGAVEVAGMGSRVVRVIADPNGRLKPALSYAVDNLTPPGAVLEMEEAGEFILLKGEAIAMQVNRDPLRLTFLDDQGRAVNQDAEAGGLGWRGAEVMVSKVMPASEHYYGFGEKTGPLDKRGTAMEMWNWGMPYQTDSDPMYQSHPFFIGLDHGRAYGIFFDNSYHSYFDMGKSDPDSYSFRAEGGPLRYYFIYGPDPKEVIRLYSGLVGRMPQPPLWALGYMQCRWSYRNEKRVREIASGFRSRNIPCDVIFLDIDYMDQFKVFTWNLRRFPDPARMISDLRRDGFKVVTIIDPGVKVDSRYAVYNQGMAQGYFCPGLDGKPYTARVWPGDCHFPDFSRPEVRDWWGELHRGLVQDGVAGIWDDMNEPCAWTRDLRLGPALLSLRGLRDLIANLSIWNSGFPLPRQSGISRVSGPIGSTPMVHGSEQAQIHHAELHNVYGLLECQATYQGLKRLRPQERPFVLTRAGYSGVQRWAAVWTGDNSSRWDHLSLTLPMLLNMGLSGMTFVGADVGGFVGSPSPELFARWIEQGVFYPFCRNHSMIETSDQEPWAFGPEVEDLSREMIRLRYQLLPYTYSLFQESVRSGLPVMRPLLLEYPRDENTYNLADEFLWGPDLLVAPVMAEGATGREVYLPEGKWYDWWTGQSFDGPQRIKARAPLEVLPLYARGGAIIPLAPTMMFTGQKPWDPITWRIYPGDQKSSFSLYEDDGRSFSYEKGQWRRTAVTVRPGLKSLTLELADPQGGYHTPARSFRFELHQLPEVASVRRRAAEAPLEWAYDTSRRVLIVQLPSPNQAETIIVEYRHSGN